MIVCCASSKSLTPNYRVTSAQRENNCKPKHTQKRMHFTCMHRVKRIHNCYSNRSIMWCSVPTAIHDSVYCRWGCSSLHTCKIHTQPTDVDSPGFSPHSWIRRLYWNLSHSCTVYTVHNSLIIDLIQFLCLWEHNQFCQYCEICNVNAFSE